MVNLSSVGRVALPLGLMTLSLHLHAREDEHPNVIFILADDYVWEVSIMRLPIWTVWQNTA